MPTEKEQRCSTSSDVSFIPLDEAEPEALTTCGLSYTRRQRRACFVSVVATFLLLLSVTIITCVLLSLVVLGKICIRHDRAAGGLLPTSVGPCSGLSGQRSHSADFDRRHSPFNQNESPRRPLYINLAIDISRVRQCKEPFSLDMPLPCKKSREFITGGSKRDASYKNNFGHNLGPLVCRDDAYIEKGGLDNCHQNAFQLAFNNTGVIIPEDGVYRVHSAMSFVDIQDYYVSSIIRIDPADCATDPVCSAIEHRRNSRAHTWLSCANHHGARKGNRFSACNIDGVRRFSRGDVVSFSVTQEFRSINPYYKTTHFFIHKL